MIRVQNILYPTDFSSYSNQAYFHALGLAKAYDATLSVVYVCTPEQAADHEFWSEQLESIRPSDPDIAVTHALLQGDPASEIVRYAGESSMDVIVIGTHGRTGQERLKMGSVAEKVMREAGCSVLVVKLPQHSAGIPRPHVALARSV